MELTMSAAGPRLSELVAAAQRGERVVITKHGAPAVEIIACPDDSVVVVAVPSDGERGSIPAGGREFDGDFFVRLAAVRKRLGVEAMPLREAREFEEALHDSALSRRVLGLGDD